MAIQNEKGYGTHFQIEEIITIVKIPIYGSLWIGVNTSTQIIQICKVEVPKLGVIYFRYQNGYNYIELDEKLFFQAFVPYFDDEAKLLEEIQKAETHLAALKRRFLKDFG